MLYLLIDGDGHAELDEAGLKDKLLDLIRTNGQVSFKTTTHTIAGQTVTIVEVTE